MPSHDEFIDEMGQRIARFYERDLVYDAAFSDDEETSPSLITSKQLEEVIMALVTSAEHFEVTRIDACDEEIVMELVNEVITPALVRYAQVTMLMRGELLPVKRTDGHWDFVPREYLEE